MLLKPKIFGVSVQLQMSRPWLKPEFRRRPASEWMTFDENYKAIKSGRLIPTRSYLFWGFFSLVWSYPVLNETFSPQQV
jgi:hypothetical protein